MKKRYLMLAILTAILSVAFTSVQAATQITSGIKYVNSSFYDIDPAEFNRIARGMSLAQYRGLPDDQKRSINSSRTIEIYGDDNPGIGNLGGWPNHDLMNTFGAPVAIQGIAADRTDGNNNIVLNYKNNNGITMIPSDAVLASCSSAFPTVYKNYQFPFYKNSQGYYEFDSNTHLVSVNTGAKRFDLYSGNNIGYTGFFPFNRVTDNLAANRNYNFGARLDMNFYMTEDGMVTDPSGRRTDMVFNFRGDDDVWVYIDGALVLDMGGPHGAVSGSINFRTKVATVSMASVNVGGSDNVAANRTKNFSISSGRHSLTLFYCERATGESNFKATFNTVEGMVTQRYVDKYTNDQLGEETLYGEVGKTTNTHAKEFTGYELIEKPSTETYTYTEDGLVVTYYYAKNSNVVTKYYDLTDKKYLHDDVVVKYKERDSYTTEKKTFDGYTYVLDTRNTSGTVGREDIEVIYYYKKNSAGLRAIYIDQVTREPIASEYTQEGLVGDGYYTKAEEVEGYVLVNVIGTEIGNLKEELTEIVYEYRKLSDVIERHIDANTGLELVPDSTVTYQEGSEYHTSEKVIPGYKLVVTPDNANGTVERENITVTYEYKKYSAGIEVRYIDQVTKAEIATRDTKEGLEGDDYTTTPKEIDEYELVVTPSNAKGKMKEELTVITYEYRRQARVTTRHIDENTGLEITNPTVEKYKEESHYTTSPQQVPGYVVTKEPDNKEGTIYREDIEVKYYYKKSSAGLIVKYVDEQTGALLDSDEFFGKEKDKVDLVAKEFTNYVLVKRPKKQQAELKTTPQEEIFYYRKVVKLDVEGIDQKTGEVLWTGSQNGIEGDPYTTKPYDVPGYELVVTPDNANGTYKRDNDKVVYEYNNQKSGKVVVKYVDKDTGKVLDEEEIKGYVGSKYTTEKREYEDYVYVNVTGTPRGEIEEGEKEVVYYYEKKTGKVIVTYEDTEGNVLLKEEMTGKVKEHFETTEKEIPGYTVVERPDKTDGEYVDGTIHLKYVLEKKKGKVTVNFKDEEGNTLFPSVTGEDYVGESFYLEAPEKEGYYIDGDKVVDVKYIDGEIVIDIIYLKEEVAIPETGDMPIALVVTIFAISIVGLLINRKGYNM